MSPKRPLSAVVLAAGEGTRMRSQRPKPLHRLCGRPMVLHVLDALAELDVDRVVVVVGHRGEWVTKTLIDHAPKALEIEFVEQPEQRGTGDAVAVALTGFPDGGHGERDGDVVVLPGDTPLLRPPTLAALVRHHREHDAAATLLTAELPDAAGYGRVVRGRDGTVARVVEEADATDEERAITEVNTSIYCFRRSVLAPALRRLSPDNAQGEYYLTDVVGVLYDAGYPVDVADGGRPDGGGRGQRPGPAGGGRGRAAGPDQRALDAARRDHVGPRADLRRRRGGAGAGRGRSCPGSSCGARTHGGRGGRDRPGVHPGRHARWASGPRSATASPTGAAIGAAGPGRALRLPRPGDRGGRGRGRSPPFTRR